MKKLFLFLTVAGFALSVSATNPCGDEKDKKDGAKKECSSSQAKSCCKKDGAKACAKAGETKSCNDTKAEAKPADNKAKK